MQTPFVARVALALLVIGLVGGCAHFRPDYDRRLAPGEAALIPVEDERDLPDFSPQWNEREDILPALERSIAWTRRKHAEQFFPIAGIEHERALRSLERLRDLLQSSTGPQDFDAAIKREFTVYKSAGWDGLGGGVLFTAYCTPILPGNLEPDRLHRYPLYALPDDLVKGAGGEILGWQTQLGLMPYPTRRSIEEGNLLAERDLELVWLRDPIDAYLAHVNGSAFVRLPDGAMFKLGYAGKNGRDYRSLGKALLDDDEIGRGELSLAGIRRWATRTDTQTVLDYLRNNDSFVFFQPIGGNPHGSLDFPVQAERSLATDKSIFPRGAAVFVQCELPHPHGGRRPFGKLMFDQDTGGAIQTAGRADIYLGVGDDAEDRAGLVHSEGQLYYLFLAE